MSVKLLYLLNTYPAPSHSFIRREIRALEAQGHSVARVAMRRPEQTLVDPGDLEEAAETRYVLTKAGLPGMLAAVLRCLVRRPGAAVRALGLAWRMGRRSDRGRLANLIYWAEAAVVREICENQGIAHIHAHFGTNPPAVAKLVKALGGPGFSFTVHGPEEFDRPIALALGEKIAQSAFTVAISSYGRSQLCRWARLEDWDKIKVVHCGIEVGRFPEPAPLPQGGPHLVAIGRFAEQKGYLVLIEAMARLKDRLPGAQLTLVGDGEMRGAMEAAIAKAGIADRITFAGWQDEAGVRAALASAQAMMLPSFAEGLPVVAMEAMAAGRLVIGTYIAGVPELVLEGETGWMVPAGDAEALAQAVERLAGTDAVRLAEMSAAGRARVLERHDVAKEAQKLAHHIQDAIGRG